MLGLGLLGWLAWVYAFSKTRESHQELSRLLEREGKNTAMVKKIGQLSKQEAYCDSLLATYRLAAKGSFQQKLLSVLSDDSAHIEILKFENPHRFFKDQSGVVQETYRFTITGRFKNMLEMIYRIEQQHLLGRILSVRFEKKDMRKSSKVYLTCTIWLTRMVQQESIQERD